MSKLFQFIEAQVNDILRMAVTDENGDVDFGKWNGWVSPANVRLFISIVASLVYIFLLSMTGIYLWNRGIAPMVPGIVQPFGNVVVAQDANVYKQLFLTILAYAVFF